VFVDSPASYALRQACFKRAKTCCFLDRRADFIPAVYMSINMPAKARHATPVELQPEVAHVRRSWDLAQQ